MRLISYKQKDHNLRAGIRFSTARSLRCEPIVFAVLLISLGAMACEQNPEAPSSAFLQTQFSSQSYGLGVEDCPAGYNIIVGTEGNDTLEGTAGNDCIVALGGDDSIYGYGGDDFIIAGDGDDYIEGGKGNDTIYGEAGGDIILGGNGNDVIFGGDGGDIIDGGRGDDQIDGGSGGDILYGNSGDDLLVGGDGDDLLIGAKGSDVCVDEGNSTSCEDVISPAAVNIAKLAARVCDAGVCLSWKTGFERHNRGFAIYRQCDGRWQRLNIKLIAGSGDVATPRVYSFVDVDGQAGDKYFIEDWDFSGQRRRHPLVVAQEFDAPPMIEQAAKTKNLSAKGLSQKSFFQTQISPVANFDRAQKFAIQGRSLFSLPSERLSPEYSWNLSQHGMSLPVLKQGAKSIFWAQAKSNRHAQHDVVIARRGPVSAMQKIVTESCRNATENVPVKVRLEQNIEYVVSKPFADDPFVWTHAMTDHDAQIHFDAAQIVAENPSNITIEIAGTSTTTQPNHLVELRLNGVLIAQPSWDGPNAQSLRFDLDAGVLRARDNLLQIRSPRSEFDYLYLNAVTLNYSRRLVANEQGFSFSAQPGSCLRLRWDNVQASPLILDVSKAEQPRLLNLVQAQFDRAGRAWVQFQVPVSGRSQVPRTLWIQSQNGIKPAAMLGPVSSLHLRESDYLAIVPPRFVEAVQPLLNWHREQGLDVQVVTTTQLYDRYSDGQPDAAVFAALMHSYFDLFAGLPRFVLLAGPASVGVQISGSDADLVPTAFSVDERFAYEAASDDTLLGLHDYAPQLRPALGRLAFRDRGEAALVVEKIISWYSQEGASAKQVLSISDQGFVDPHEQMTFSQLNAMTDMLRETGQWHNQTFAISEHPSAIPDLLDRINVQQYPDLVQYFGHAFVSGWSSPQVMDLQMAQNLSNEKLFGLFSWACFDGSFVGPWADSLVWEMIANPHGGAYAALASASLTDPTHSAELAAALWWILSRPNAPTQFALAVRQAKNLVSDQGEELDYALDAFNVLGDPAAPLY